MNIYKDYKILYYIRVHSYKLIYTYEVFRTNFFIFFILNSRFSNRFIFLLCSPHLPWIVRICMRIAVHMLNSMRLLVMSLTRHRKQSINGGRIKLFKFPNFAIWFVECISNFIYTSLITLQHC